MTWTEPRDWTTNEVVTSSHLNTHVRDNFKSVLHPYDYSSSDTDVVSTAVETSLWSKVITGGDLGTSGLARLRIVGDYLYNNSASDTIRFRVKFGGTTLLDTGVFGPATATNSARSVFELDVDLANRGATNAQVIHARMLIPPPNPPTTGIGAVSSTTTRWTFMQNTATIDTTADQTFQVTAQWSTSSANDSWRKRLAVLLLGQN